MSTSYKMAVYKQEFPEGNSRPYKIIETYQTSDGYRSRLCDGNFVTLDEAKADLKRRANELYGPVAS